MFYDKFKRLCDQRGLSPSAVVKALGLSTGNIAAWKRGQTPKYERLVAIADFFGVSIDELAGEPVQEGDATNRIDSAELVDYLDQLRDRPEMRMLFSVAKNAKKSEIEAIVRFIESLRKS